MAKAAMRDIFSNKAYGTVTESAANTLTFAEIQTNTNVFSKVAWILNRIEWYINSAAIAALAAGGDGIQMALTASNNITSMALDEPSVIDMFQTSLHALTAVGFEQYDYPKTRDFADLPGGGLIIAPRPLFVAVQGTSLGSAITAECRLYFQQIEMTPAEYLELIDFYRIVS